MRTLVFGANMAGEILPLADVTVNCFERITPSFEGMANISGLISI